MSLTGISAHVLFNKISLLLLWFTLLAWKLAEILIRCFLLFARDLELQLHRSAGLFPLKLQEIYHLCSVPFYLTYVRILTHLNKYFSCSNRPCSCRDTLNRGQFLTGYIIHLFVLAVPVTVLRSSYCLIPSWLAVFLFFYLKALFDARGAPSVFPISDLICCLSKLITVFTGKTPRHVL